MAQLNQEVEFTNGMLMEIIVSTVEKMDLDNVGSIRIAKVDGELIFAITPTEKDDENYEVVKTGDKININTSLGV